jgi:hypothetical protein
MGNQKIKNWAKEEHKNQIRDVFDKNIIVEDF